MYRIKIICQVAEGEHEHGFKVTRVARVHENVLENKDLVEETILACKKLVQSEYPHHYVRVIAVNMERHIPVPSDAAMRRQLIDDKI